MNSLRRAILTTTGIGCTLLSVGCGVFSFRTPIEASADDLAFPADLPTADGGAGDMTAQQDLPPPLGECERLKKDNNYTLYACWDLRDTKEGFAFRCKNSVTEWKNSGSPGSWGIELDTKPWTGDRLCELDTPTGKPMHYPNETEIVIRIEHLRQIPYIIANKIDIKPTVQFELHPKQPGSIPILSWVTSTSYGSTETIVEEHRLRLSESVSKVPFAPHLRVTMLAESDQKFTWSIRHLSIRAAGKPSPVQ